MDVVYVQIIYPACCLKLKKLQFCLVEFERSGYVSELNLKDACDGKEKEKTFSYGLQWHRTEQLFTNIKSILEKDIIKPYIYNALIAKTTYNAELLTDSSNARCKIKA